MLTRDQVPFYLLAVAGGFLGAGQEPVRIEGTVYFVNRESVSFAVEMSHESNVEILGFPNYESGGSPTARDRRLFTAAPSAGEHVSVSWKRRTREAVNIGFIQSTSDYGIVQRVTVGGELVRLLVDRNRDGNLDFELMDVDRDGVAEKKGLPQSVTPMPAWPPSAV